MHLWNTLECAIAQGGLTLGARVVFDARATDVGETGKDDFLQVLYWAWKYPRTFQMFLYFLQFPLLYVSIFDHDEEILLILWCKSGMVPKSKEKANRVEIDNGF